MLTENVRVEIEERMRSGEKARKAVMQVLAGSKKPQERDARSSRMAR
ncbi:MAG: hypothetical protein KC652_15225 [Cyanobacteria bacterium HKST-UBA01]|nr:hypothetical protein [Cyanobacteria bacterium HKST-UBA01]